MLGRRYITILLIFIIAFIAVYMSFTQSFDFTQDLGRHLLLGKIIVATKSVPGINMFSYTHPNFPFLNHHWLSEVVFYILYSASPIWLQILKIILLLSALFISGFTAYRQVKNVWAVCLIILLSLPLYFSRATIRPELFGYLFFSIFLYYLVILPKSINKYFLLTFIIGLWINLHITFIFGVFLFGIIIFKYISQNFKSLANKDTAKLFAVFLLFLFFLFFAHPGGYRAALYPLQIFGNYGYSIAENQTLLFMYKYTNASLIYSYFFAIVVFSILASLGLFFLRKWFEGLVLLVFAFAGLWQIRHMPFLALSLISLSYGFLKQIKSILHLKKKRISAAVQVYIPVIILLLAFVFFISLTTGIYFEALKIRERPGIAIHDPFSSALDYVEKNGVRGRIWNNFDIGGYVAYRLYPNSRVYVDNRPEAYPADFFQNEYIKAHTDPYFRKKIFRKYNIGTIIYSLTDQTPWARQFLRSLFKDTKAWSIAYIDTSTVVFYKKQANSSNLQRRKLLINAFSQSNDPFEIERFAGVMSDVGEQDIAQSAWAYLLKRFPLSCSSSRYRYFVQAKSGSIALKHPWYCF